MTRTPNIRRSKAFALLGVTVVVAGLSAVAIAQVGAFDASEIFADEKNETSKAEIEAEDEALVALGEANPGEAPEDPENAGPTSDPDCQRRSKPERFPPVEN
ncbi:MAG: hypothetical protein WEE66_13885 [Actinomycetota bacterium]